MLLCQNCDYWHDGKCKKSPPRLFAINPSLTEFRAIYPATEATDGCGGGSAIMECEELRFKNNSESLIIKPPTLTETKTLILPDGDGTVEQVLKTDGEGNLGWKTITSFEYIDGGDPSNYTFTKGDLIADGQWHDLDFSGKVPAGTKLVRLRIDIVDNAIGSIIRLRKKGNTNDPNRVQMATLVANMSLFDDKEVWLDENLKAEYWLTATVWSVITLCVSAYGK